MKPAEVTAIEGDDTVHPVDVHRGDETGVVDLDALHIMRDDQPFPFRVDIRGFGEDGKETFEAAPLLTRFVRRKSEAVPPA